MNAENQRNPMTNPAQPASESWLAELNPEQRRAVMHGEGPLLVVAGAGSGKTRTLAYRVAHLISSGIDPSRILLLTFTRRAAQEMIKRAWSVTQHDTQATGRIWGGTFHAIGNRLLRIYAKAVDLDPDFTVMDQSDAEDMIHVIRHDLGLHNKEHRFPRKRTCLAVYSRCVNGEDELNAVLERYFPWCSEWEEELRRLFQEYVTRKQARNVLDYDDLLLYWAELVREDMLGREIGGRFDHILVDEFQDTNRVQSRILTGMRRECRNLTVVGDDAQSIYSFRSATVRNMLDFPETFAGTTVVTLERNYRSTPQILETTNRVIAQAAERYSKELRSECKNGEQPRLVTAKDEPQQDEYIIDRVLAHYEEGVPLRQQAVLFRAAHLSDSLEIELARRNIPFHKYGGLRFLEAAHVKDLVSFLRIAENPRDEMAWFRTLQLLDGIGPATAARIVRHVAEQANRPAAVASFAAPAAAAEQLQAYARVMSDLTDQPPLPPASQVERIRRFYEPLLSKLYENPGARARDLENLEQIASGYQARGRFLVDLQLDPPTSTSDLAGPPSRDEDWLVLSTIHSAKGCEWDVVYLMHASDGCLPSDMSTGREEEMEEERRLAYVAMTRARNFLYVTWPLRYYHRRYAFGDQHSYAQLSRFLTDDVVKSMQPVALQQDTTDDVPVVKGGAADIKARLRSRWA